MKTFHDSGQERLLFKARDEGRLIEKVTTTRDQEKNKIGELRD